MSVVTMKLPPEEGQGIAGNPDARRVILDGRGLFRVQNGGPARVRVQHGGGSNPEIDLGVGESTFIATQGGSVDVWLTDTTPPPPIESAIVVVEYVGG